jgi:hypothetical protein
MKQHMGRVGTHLMTNSPKMAERSGADRAGCTYLEVQNSSMVETKVVVEKMEERGKFEIYLEERSARVVFFH